MTASEKAACPVPKDAGFRERYEALFDGGRPLDGSHLARDIADTVPQANRMILMREFREELKRRVRERLTDNTSSGVRRV